VLVKWLWRIGVAPFFALRMILFSIALALDRICVAFDLKPILVEIFDDMQADMKRTLRDAIQEATDTCLRLEADFETSKATFEESKTMMRDIIATQAETIQYKTETARAQDEVIEKSRKLLEAQRQKIRALEEQNEALRKLAG